MLASISGQVMASVRKMGAEQLQPNAGILGV
jgi:hypothetical protein